MVILRDRNILKYNRDKSEITRLQIGRGLTYHQINHGDGIGDYANSLWNGAKKYTSSAANYVSGAASTAKKTAFGAVGEKIGSTIGKKVGENAGSKILTGVKKGL